MKLFDSTNIPVLGRALDAYALRHKAIASNIANVNTVGYRAKTVSFEDQLAGAMQTAGISGSETNGLHMPIGAQQGSEEAPIAVRETPAGGGAGDPLVSGANNVDIDTEMAELAKNQIRYKFSAHLLSVIFKQLQASIRGNE